MGSKLCNTYQSILKCEYTDVAAVVYMITAHDWVSEVLHPDTSQGITGDLVVLICALCVIRDV